ncbi:hypothetical protein TNCV_4226981 [Trichonephila clavipes]|nr:hypothetical protein TNCV_4226981 [Trichonephila clavipes]
MVGGKYGMKRLKANTLQQLLARFRLEAGALWMVASTSRTLRSVIQLTAYVRGSKSTRISLSFFRVQKTHLTSPINNLWNPLDSVIRVMDPHARNLVQQ